MAVDGCSENQLAPAVVDAEVFDLLDTYRDRADLVIQPVIIGGKCGGDKHRRICFKYPDDNKSGISAAHCIGHHQFIPHTVDLGTINSNGIINIRIIQAGGRTPEISCTSATVKLQGLPDHYRGITPGKCTHSWQYRYDHGITSWFWTASIVYCRQHIAGCTRRVQCGVQ